MKYVRLYSNGDGRARFEDLEFTLAPRNFAPPAPSVNISDAVGASAFMVARLPAGWTDTAHPTPARQFMIVLGGSLEMSAGTETRSFSAGDVVLLEDTSGQGHGATVLEDVRTAVVQL